MPHLHTHIIPRFKNDHHDDSIHKQLEKTDLGAAYEDFFARKKQFQDSPGFISTPDEDRHPRAMPRWKKRLLGYVKNWQKPKLQGIFRGCLVWISRELLLRKLLVSSVNRSRAIK